MLLEKTISRYLKMVQPETYTFKQTEPSYCLSAFTFLASLCQYHVLLYEPLQHQVSCWMLCHVQLQQKNKRIVRLKSSRRPW